MPSTRGRAVIAVGLAVRPVGKSDAGNPYVRFDERGRETGCCRMAQATAPVLDSTPSYKKREWAALPPKPAFMGSGPPLRGDRNDGPPEPITRKAFNSSPFARFVTEPQALQLLWYLAHLCI